MDDVGLMAVAESLIGYVDERYGRAAAWIAVILPIASLPLVLVTVLWLTLSLIGS